MTANRKGSLDEIVRHANEMLARRRVVADDIAYSPSPVEDLCELIEKASTATSSPANLLYELVEKTLKTMSEDQRKRFWKLIGEHPDNPIQEVEYQRDELRERGLEVFYNEDERRIQRLTWENFNFEEENTELAAENKKFRQGGRPPKDPNIDFDLVDQLQRTGMKYWEILVEKYGYDRSDPKLMNYAAALKQKISVWRTAKRETETKTSK